VVVGNDASFFVWDEEGRIVTNHHVIDGASRITVIFSDRTEMDATLLGSDPDSDLAVLQIDVSDAPTQPVPLADSDAVKVGQMRRPSATHSDRSSR